MKRPTALLFCLLMITMPMSGCLEEGDDSSDVSDEELGDWNVHFAATAADLPTCDEDTNGRLYYVEADNQFQVCKTSGWSVIEIQGEDGVDGVAGNDGADGADGSITLIRVLSSISCETGGNTFEIGPDINDDGVLDISEIGLTVDICNGNQGPQGVAGNDGVDGQNGTDGEMGLTGPIGLTGNDGTNSLISSMNEPSGVNCAAGGMKISVGFDYDNDTNLSMNEIINTMYVCDGSDGVTTTLPWNNISNIPNDLLDGDNDTTYSGNDFAISGQTCSGTSMVIAAIDVTGSIICVYDQDTLYDGNDFATSNQSCPTGEFLSGITLTGKLVCSVPVDSTLSEAQVDAFVANNNYANATDVSNMQSVLDNVTTCVIGAYANCSGMYLYNVDLSNMDLTGIDFSHSDLNNVDFSNSGLKFADFSGADIDDVNFSYTDIKHAVFSGATISNTDFSNSTMEYASIDGADFHRPVFTGADLTKVDFSKIDIMTNTYTSGYSSCSVYTTRNLQGAVYSGYLYGSMVRYWYAIPISFESAILDGANFEGMELWPVDLTNASGVYVNFDDTIGYDDFTSVRWCSVSGSLPKVSGNSSAPSAYYFYGGNYQTTYYRHEHSTFTDFDGESSSFEMSRILDDANMQRADLRDSNLMYVDFSNANLTDAELDYSWLHFTNFDDAIVTGVDFYNSNWYQTVWTNGLAYNSNQG